MESAPFQFYMPMTDILKSDDGRMRFGGFTSSNAKDLEGEDVIQKGLDFDEFESSGWFNVNHSQDLTGDGLVGVPDDEKSVRWLKKGDPKPVTGEKTDRDGWYVLGDLIDTREGRSIWEKAAALKKLGTRRHLGMSLEGEVVEREGPKILKAKVRKIAITERPVNRDTTMEVLTKAFTGEGPWVSDEASPELRLLEKISNQLDVFMKALSAGAEIDNPADPVCVIGQGGKQPEPTQKALTAGAAVDAPATSEPGDGFAMRTEDLDGHLRTTTFEKTAPVTAEDTKETSDKKETDALQHDGITGPAINVPDAKVSKSEPGPNVVVWTPTKAQEHLEQRYPHLSKGQLNTLVEHLFSHLGGN